MSAGLMKPAREMNEESLMTVHLVDYQLLG